MDARIVRCIAASSLISSSPSETEATLIYTVGSQPPSQVNTCELCGLGGGVWAAGSFESLFGLHTLVAGSVGHSFLLLHHPLSPRRSFLDPSLIPAHHASSIHPHSRLAGTQCPLVSPTLSVSPSTSALLTRRTFPLPASSNSAGYYTYLGAQVVHCRRTGKVALGNYVEPAADEPKATSVASKKEKARRYLPRATRAHTDYAFSTPFSVSMKCLVQAEALRFGPVCDGKERGGESSDLAPLPTLRWRPHALVSAAKSARALLLEPRKQIELSSAGWVGVRKVPVSRQVHSFLRLGSLRLRPTC